MNTIRSEDIRRAVQGYNEAPAAYEKVLSSCKRAFSEGGTASVCSWIVELTKCVSCFGRKTHHIIDVLLEQDLWALQDARELLLEFLSALVSSCSLYGEACMAYLIKYLYRPLPPVAPEHLEQLEELREQLDEKVLRTLYEILDNAPGQIPNFVHVLKIHVPHPCQPVYVHRKFCHNIYDFTLAFPHIMKPVLETMIAQIIKMDTDMNALMAFAPIEPPPFSDVDVHDSAQPNSEQTQVLPVQLEDENLANITVENTENNLDGAGSDNPISGDQTFACESSESDSNQTDSNSTAAQDNTAEYPSFGKEEREKLDIVLSYTLDFINHKLYEDDGDPDGLFKILMDIFDKQVLLAYHSSHVQFLWFFAAHFGDGHLATVFVDTCLSKLGDPSFAVIVQQSAIAYVASFIARANYINLNYVASVVETCVDWAKAYIDRNRNMIPNVHLHTSFYALCQALFYILCFRCRAFVEAEDGHRWLKSLSLETIARSSLNPLKFVTSSVAEEFARVMRHYEVLLCDMEILQNRNASVASMSLSSSYLSAAVQNGDIYLNELESFFPFDPIALPRSLAYIKPYYQDWLADLCPGDLAAPSLIVSGRATNVHSSDSGDEDLISGTLDEKSGNKTPTIADEQLVSETEGLHLSGAVTPVLRKALAKSVVSGCSRSRGPGNSRQGRRKCQSIRRSNPSSGPRSLRTSRATSPSCASLDTNERRSSVHISSVDIDDTRRQKHYFGGSKRSHSMARVPMHQSTSIVSKSINDIRYEVSNEDDDDFLLPEPPQQDETQITKLHLATLQQLSAKDLS